MKALIIITSVFLFTIFNIQFSYSQVTQEWVARYSGTGNLSDQSRSIAVDDLGNVYITGFSYIGTNNNDFVTIKYDSSGDTLWVKSYNGPGNNLDGARSIAVDNQGNVYVTGSSTGSGSGLDYATIKYNSSGVQQWVQRYNGPANNGDGSVSIALDNLGNAYITGSSVGLCFFRLKTAHYFA